MIWTPRLWLPERPSEARKRLRRYQWSRRRRGFAWMPCGCSGDCDFCSGSAPNEFEVQLPPLFRTAAGGDCDEADCLACDDLPIVVTRTADEEVCCWEGPGCGGDCGGELLLCLEANGDPVGVGLIIVLTMPGSGGVGANITWQKIYTADPPEIDCNSFVDEQIDFLSTDNLGVCWPDFDATDWCLVTAA